MAKTCAEGRERQFLAVGRINNVDLRRGLRYGGAPLDLAVATQRDEAGLVLFEIRPDGTRNFSPQPHRRRAAAPTITRPANSKATLCGSGTTLTLMLSKRQLPELLLMGSKPPVWVALA